MFVTADCITPCTIVTVIHGVREHVICVLGYVKATDSLGFGAPNWGSHKKMTETHEQELREFVRLKHHSNGFKNQQLG